MREETDKVKPRVYVVFRAGKLFCSNLLQNLITTKRPESYNK